jgi:hypothetical protein
MGGSSSKPAPTGPVLPQVLQPDISKATFSGDYIANLAKQNAEIQAASAKAAADAQAATAAALAAASRWKYGVYGLLGLGVAILVAIIIYDIVARFNGWQTIMIPGVAHFTNFTEGLDNTSPIDVKSGSAPFSSTQTPSSSLYIPGPTGATGPTGPAGSGTGGSVPGSTGAAPPPPMLYQWYYGTGNMPDAVDAQKGTTVTAAGAPLSAGNQGAYGMQWWMYVKDWNYGYGHEKPVLIRPDATNPAVLNPKVTLHPTDNVLRISVSVFPSDHTGGVSEPAPANAPETADDVFTCEVPNIPLQSWFSVSLTVFERNLDVYLNGMLVKSCFLSGVPKPAVGDIQITPNGGFSGQVCGLQTSSKVINPSDAIAFYAASNSCVTTNPSAPNAGAMVNTTGYSVKFGLFDTVGKQLREYTF